MPRFFELPIGQRFVWRDREWIKTTYSHARPVDDPQAPDTFVPNQECVTVSANTHSEGPAVDTTE